MCSVKEKVEVKKKENKRNWFKVHCLSNVWVDLSLSIFNLSHLNFVVSSVFFLSKNVSYFRHTVSLFFGFYIQIVEFFVEKSLIWIVYLFLFISVKCIYMLSLRYMKIWTIRIYLLFFASNPFLIFVGSGYHNSL